MKKLLYLFAMLFFASPVFAKYERLFSAQEYDGMIASVKESCATVKDTIYADLIDLRFAEDFASKPDLPIEILKKPTMSFLELNVAYIANEPWQPEAKCQASQARVLDTLFSRKNDVKALDVKEFLTWMKVVYYRNFYEEDVSLRKQAQQKLEHLHMILRQETLAIEPTQRNLVLAALYLTVGKIAPYEERDSWFDRVKALLKTVDIQECSDSWRNSSQDASVLFQSYACGIRAGWRFHTVFDAYEQTSKSDKFLKDTVNALVQAAKDTQ
jgi:hypothetical protein